MSEQPWRCVLIAHEVHTASIDSFLCASFFYCSNLERYVAASQTRYSIAGQPAAHAQCHSTLMRRRLDPGLVSESGSQWRHKAQPSLFRLLLLWGIANLPPTRKLHCHRSMGTRCMPTMHTQAAAA
eukprot:COSAG06_NODE_2524_length_6725_cov_3.984606_4_plen_126_part_00